MFDGKHSDQTVLNKLPELITEGAEEERMREEGRGERGEVVTNWKKNTGNVCFLNLI